MHLPVYLNFDEMIIGHYSVEVLHLWGWHHPFFIQLPGHLEAYLRHSISLRQNYTECRSMVRWSRHLRQQSCWRRASEADLYWQGCLAADGSSAISIHFPGRIWKNCFLILSCIDHCLAKSDLVSVFRVFQESLWHKDRSICHWTVCNCQFVF